MKRWKYIYKYFSNRKFWAFGCHDHNFFEICTSSDIALLMSKKGLPFPGKFFGFALLSLGHGHVHWNCNKFMDLTLEGRNEGDHLWLGPWHCRSAPSWPARRPCQKLTFLRFSPESQPESQRLHYWKHAPSVFWNKGFMLNLSSEECNFTGRVKSSGNRVFWTFCYHKFAFWLVRTRL